MIKTGFILILACSFPNGDNWEQLERTGFKTINDCSHYAGQLRSINKDYQEDGYYFFDENKYCKLFCRKHI